MTARRGVFGVAVLVAMLGGAWASRVQAQDAPPPAVDALHKPFDEILDLYVRDGEVYYNAVRSERARFDRYLRALGEVPAATEAGWSHEQKLAFWVNAYNAFVLQTVVDSYPIRGRSAQYPASSIRQIPGSFERKTFRVAGQMLTLDQIEKERVLPLGDARAFFALGRGAMGGGRLKSEAYSAARIDEQLSAVMREIVDRKELVFVDRPAQQLSISPLFSWREAQFVATYADKAPARYANRSPLEKAVMAMLDGSLLQTERDFLEANTFEVVFHDFDWRLNDLNNRGR